VIPWLSSEPGDIAFPPTDSALPEPNGLLAVGGLLSPERLLAAYRRGIFPWYEEGQPILWWTPDPRAVLFPDELKISRSLAKTLRNGRFLVSVDRDFCRVTEGCAAPRREAGTWITPQMAQAYQRMHELGFAHSVETWHEGELVGGLYGMAIGRVFFGESMFSLRRDASKVALVHLVARLSRMGVGLIDCQLPTPHLTRLGSRLIPRREFEALLDNLCPQDPRTTAWAEVPATPQLPGDCPVGA
jgi:leucyl/phenylalanyl-tRNA--protein transferase